MAHFGAFAPFGLLSFGENETDASAIYATMLGAQNKAFDTPGDSHVEASAMARALAIASVRASLHHANGQRHPMTAVELLPEHEFQYGITPTTGQSDDRRRRIVAARKILSQGPKRTSLQAALRRLLGDDFITVRSIYQSEVVVLPSTPETVGAWADPARASKVFELVNAIAYPGSGVEFAYQHRAADDGTRLAVGDVMCMQPENYGLAENITITAVDNSVVPFLATADIVHSHDQGATMTTYAPILTSNQRSLIIVLTSAAARSAQTRRDVEDLLGRTLRGVTTWSIVESTAPTTAGPWVLGTSRIGITPLGPTPLSTV